MDYPTTVLQPGQSTTLTVRLKTTTQGYLPASCVLATNDSDESALPHLAGGIVAPPESDTLIPGLSVRKAAEGSKFFANIRRTGNLTSAVTVSLSTDGQNLLCDYGYDPGRSRIRQF